MSETMVKINNIEPMIADIDEPPRVKKRDDGKLWLINEEGEFAVEVGYCFPWSDPQKFISLRDEDGDERALIESLDELDKSSQVALASALKSASFVMEISGVEKIEEDFEIRLWQVRTEQGDRRFQTKLDDWPWNLPDGGILIRDVAGDLFFIDDPATLDKKSQDLLWAFIG